MSPRRKLRIDCIFLQRKRRRRVRENRACAGPGRSIVVTNPVRRTKCTDTSRFNVIKVSAARAEPKEMAGAILEISRERCIFPDILFNRSWLEVLDSCTNDG